jgi:pSer/pThr/pTyr-binding forkhead associated (FHA) protein
MTWLGYNEELQELRGDSEVVVGTGAQATCRVRRADLLPRHFIVSMVENRATIRPFSGEAIVTVNGRQIPTGASELRDGDLISAGSGEFRFWATTPGDSRSALKAPLTAHLIDARRQSALSLFRVSSGIGSDESNALVIEGDVASSFQAEVRREAGGHVLRSPESAVVRLNGRPVTAPQLLNERDEIEIGDLQLQYTREPLPDGITSVRLDRVTSSAGKQEAAASRRPRMSPAADFSSVVTMRAPMRAVAFVSSVIAAVAIATLLFMHRSP